MVEIRRDFPVSDPPALRRGRPAALLLMGASAAGVAAAAWLWAASSWQDALLAYVATILCVGALALRLAGRRPPERVRTFVPAGEERGGLGRARE